MFGPGLECDARGLVRKLLHDHTSPFEIMGMFPGQFDGKLNFHFLIITFINFGLFLSLVMIFCFS